MESVIVFRLIVKIFSVESAEVAAAEETPHTIIPSEPLEKTEETESASLPPEAPTPLLEP